MAAAASPRAMPITGDEGAIATAATSQDSSRRQIRGSALLLAGRGISILLNLVTQIVMIRGLTRDNFGTMAYVLSIVEMLAIVATLGMDKTFQRYGAIYHEQNDRPRLVGTMIFSGIFPALLGMGIVGWVWLDRAIITPHVMVDQLTMTLLMLAIVMVPLTALASVALSWSTAIQGARTAFFRKHLLGPILKLAAVAGVVLAHGGAQEILAGLVIASVIGLASDVWLAVRLITREGLAEYFPRNQHTIPLYEIIAFTLPTLCSDFAFVARGAMKVFLLGSLGSVSATASFRSVLPIAKLNEIVIANFAVMFISIASRLYASKNTAELGEMYRRSSMWIMAASFPVFAATVLLADSMIPILFGSVYQDSSSPLIILSAAMFIQAAFGSDVLMLNVFGRLREQVVIDVIGGIVTIITAYILIPTMQADGAAVAISVGILIGIVMKSVVLFRLVHDPSSELSGLHKLPTSGAGWTYSASRTIVLSLATFVTLFAWLGKPDFLLGTMLVIASTLLVIWACRNTLSVGLMFPELAKMSSVLQRKNGNANSADPVAAYQKASQPVGSSDSVPNAGSSLRVAYVMSRFPKLTETFVVREMIEMERLGVTVLVYPLQREPAKVVQPEAEPFVSRACFTGWISGPILLANVVCLLTQPITYVWTLLLLIKANWRSRRFLTGALLFFPKTVYLAARMKRDGVNHLHAHFASHPAMAAWTIHRLSGIPYSFTAHGSDLHRERAMLSQKVQGASFVVAISDYNRKIIIDECGQAERVHVIHCGIDPSVFPASRSATPYEQGIGPFQAICVGTLHEVKGQRYLLEACGLLMEQGKDVVVHLVGDGPDQEMLEQLARQRLVTTRVHFHGRKTSPEIAKLFQAMDAMVTPSVPSSDGRREGIPVVLMEAMGSCLPVIASDLSGIPELVRNEQSGLLTPPTDAPAIARAINRLREDRELRHKLVEGGLAIVRQEFDSAKNARTLYQLILDQTGRVARS